jgi:hypothetical protein
VYFPIFQSICVFQGRTEVLPCGVCRLYFKVQIEKLGNTHVMNFIPMEVQFENLGNTHKMNFIPMEVQIENLANTHVMNLSQRLMD